MDSKLTQAMQDWLNAPSETRSLVEGADMVLRLTNNRFMHQNILARRDTKMVEYQLQKYLTSRLNHITHEQVVEMKAQADSIAEAHHLDTTRKQSKSQQDEYRKGKREDHDTLPDDIQALYAENLNILHRMRECHLQARHIALADTTCSDCDIYPFVKELIALDKQYRANWQAYDTYGRESINT